MPRPSVIPTVKAALEDYLERMQAAFLAVPAAQRSPTLPATPDGKVNVRALGQAIDLKQTQEKYLFERQELTSLINLVSARCGHSRASALAGPMTGFRGAAVIGSVLLRGSILKVCCPRLRIGVLGPEPAPTKSC